MDDVNRKTNCLLTRNESFSQQSDETNKSDTVALRNFERSPAQRTTNRSNDQDCSNGATKSICRFPIGWQIDSWPVKIAPCCTWYGGPVADDSRSVETPHSMLLLHPAVYSWSWANGWDFVFCFQANTQNLIPLRWDHRRLVGRPTQMLTHQHFSDIHYRGRYWMHVCRNWFSVEVYGCCCGVNHY